MLELTLNSRFVAKGWEGQNWSHDCRIFSLQFKLVIRIICAALPSGLFQSILRDCLDWFRIGWFSSVAEYILKIENPIINGKRRNSCLGWLYVCVWKMWTLLKIRINIYICIYIRRPT